MSEPKINFSLDDTPFIPAEREKSWIDSSFSHAPNAIGPYRWLGVSNGNYESRHPILNENGDTIGFISDAATDLGYTWQCVYAGDCFWITNMTFYATRKSIDVSTVSIVEQKGKFLFSSDRKFKVVESFSFGTHWVHSTKAFKLLNDGRQLLYLTDNGFCLFDTYSRRIVAQKEFTDRPFYFNFTLSPKANILAMAYSKSKKDILDGEYRYNNFIRLYNLETGLVLGEQILDVDGHAHWTVDFSEDGRQLRATTDRITFVFKIRTT